jgi:hypothetical protein
MRQRAQGDMKMKRFLWLVPAILFLGLTAQAQETPAWEVSGGYSYLRSNLQGKSFGLKRRLRFSQPKPEQLVWRQARD